MKGDVVEDVDGAFGLSDKVDVDGLGFRDGREGILGEDGDGDCSGADGFDVDGAGDGFDVDVGADVGAQSLTRASSMVRRLFLAVR